MSARVSFVTLTLVLTLVVFGRYKPVHSQSSGCFSGFELVDKTGNIRKPSDFRDRYQALGTYTVLDPKVTYASPGTAEYYRKKGRFADGTVLVKEIFGTDHAQMTTGERIGPRGHRFGSS